MTDLVDPVRVENPQSSQLAPCTLLRNRPQVTLELQLRNTLVLGLSVHDTLSHWPLPASTADTDAVDHVSLQLSQGIPQSENIKMAWNSSRMVQQNYFPLKHYSGTQIKREETRSGQ
jgi:hypothetical protein